MPILAEHQREAVDRAVEILAAHGGAILADDVGLGKSFVAAEVARRSGREVDVVVPASLVPQWRETLAAFGVEASLMTHESLLRSPIVSDPSRRRLIVVDEAHAFRNPATQKYDALARRSIGASLLLVTATPFCNRIGDVRALVDLIAVDDALSSTGIPSIDVAFDRRDLIAIDAILASLIIRRGPAVLPNELRFGTLDRQIVWHPVLDIRNEVGALIFPLVGSAPLLRRFLWRRLESSEEALLESVRRQLRFYERALECLANGSSVLQKRDYRRAFGHEEDRDAFQQVLFWDLFVPPGGGVSAAVIEEEVRRLHVLRNVVERSPRDKRLLLVERCESESEPMLVFTGSTATARDLATFLPGRCGLVTARERERQSIIESFRRGSLDRLICTDLAAEGLNLQRAGVVVHYDIPWNPVKLDQRNGRAHRMGQERASVSAIYFLPLEDPSGAVETVFAKNRVRRRLLPSRGPHAVARERAVSSGSDREGLASLPPRVSRDASAVRFYAALARQRLDPPPGLMHRHPAGMERLLAEMSREYLDEQRLRDLAALIAPI